MNTVKSLKRYVIFLFCLCNALTTNGQQQFDQFGNPIPTTNNGFQQPPPDPNAFGNNNPNYYAPLGSPSYPNTPQQQYSLNYYYPNVAANNNSPTLNQQLPQQQQQYPYSSSPPNSANNFYNPPPNTYYQPPSSVATSSSVYSPSNTPQTTYPNQQPILNTNGGYPSTTTFNGGGGYSYNYNLPTSNSDYTTALNPASLQYSPNANAYPYAVGANSRGLMNNPYYYGGGGFHQNWMLGGAYNRPLATGANPQADHSSRVINVNLNIDGDDDEHEPNPVALTPNAPPQQAVAMTPKEASACYEGCGQNGECKTQGTVCQAETWTCCKRFSISF